MQKITPMLWFDTQAEEAANLYIDVFSKRPGSDQGKSQVVSVSHYTEGSPGPAGSVMVVEFELEGQSFTGLNGGQQQFGFNEAISFVVNCESQEEVDYFWDALSSNGGEESVCGWLKDRYGVSWQITPTGMDEMLNSPNQEGAKRAMQAMLGMKKIDLAELQRAFDGA
jgi:predicted 3-demethylubiquinone-9 3-methyltransferase (glyoxalase superfamily)